LTVTRRLSLVAAVFLLGLGAAAWAVLRPAGDGRAQAKGCPPGFADREDRMRTEYRERLSGVEAEGHGEEELSDAVAAGGPQQDIAEGPACVARKHPEKIAELMAMQEDGGRRAGSPTGRVRPGAYRSAVAQRRRLAAGRATLPGTGGTWEPAGKTPLVSDDERFNEVNGAGFGELAGRVSDFTVDPTGGRLFAAIGEGGVWESTDRGKTWRSIGDSLPTQAVGSVGFTPAGGGTLIAATGDSVFGGGGTFAGMGVYRSTDGGKTWQHSTGVPDGVISFRVAVDPSNANVVYVATGGGLFRSADAGATFENVRLPTGAGVAEGQPECTGAPPGKEGCFLANMVTDVVVQGSDNAQTADDSPGARAGSVVATVGWRAGAKTSPPSKSFPDGYTESPNNGIYRSNTGAPGTFEKLAASGFTAQDRIGRIELGHAKGPAQDHNYLYAIVEDAVRFRGGAPVLDVPSDPSGPLPNDTVLDGVYVSADFGATWTQMTAAEALKNPASGSALTPGASCPGQYCPGIQAWYNQFIAPDPTRQTDAGVPTRLLFGLEEVWENRDSSQALTGPSDFKVVAPYYSGSTCFGLRPKFPACPTTAGNPVEANTTAHPDQHAVIWLPEAGGGVTAVVGHDGGVNTQTLAADGELSPDAWGRGANQGFNTLLPYDAQVAKDGTIYAGLQDNGEMKIEPDGRQLGLYGGDGGFSAVDPDNSKVAYEQYVYNDLAKTTDGGVTWSSVAPPADTYQFINPFTMDPGDASHLITAGTNVYETTDGAGSWTQVFDLGTRTEPGDPDAAATEDSPDNRMSAIDVRSTGAPLPSGGKTADFAFEGGAGTAPGGPTPQETGVDPPGTYFDRPFTIAPNEGNRSATIELTWDVGANDWDLVVFRKEGEELVQVGSSAGGVPETSERVVLTKPRPGEYVIRVRNFAAGGTFKGTTVFEQAKPGDTVAGSSAAYVGYCGYCDALNVRPFANGIATNVKPDGTTGQLGKPDGWRIAKAAGLPERYITSVQVDPIDPKVVYATVAGYSRRWLPVGVLGEDADLGKGSVFKSTDAGETFTSISGNLPDAPANWTAVRNGQLVVATEVGVFIPKDTNGGSWDPLGVGLPPAPVFTLELKPKASDGEPDTLIAASQGRGVYRYVFKEPAKEIPPEFRPTAPPTACVASAGFRSVSATASGRRVRLGFQRRVSAPVTVDVFQHTRGSRIVGERLVFRRRSTRPFTWNGKANRRNKRMTDGTYSVRYRVAAGGTTDVRRVVLRRRRARFARRPDFHRRDSCRTLRAFKLERPAFGGPGSRSLGISYRLLSEARVQVRVQRGNRTVKTFKTVTRKPGRTFRLRLSAKGLRRGDHRVVITVTRGSERIRATLTAARL